ncbi:MAG TPA: serine/threonine-protein kinase [Gemmatimonadaceae bacterium]|nr:serine/threonine-protein kinase [Gemmatimonadaceae bacterium]
MANTCPTCGKVFEDSKVFCSDDMSLLIPSAESDPLVGTIIAERYLITGKIGEGGMGRVYRGQHVLLEGRQVAIKVLQPWLLHDGEALRRFKREASNASSINNSHVAQVYDFGEAGGGLVYLAIEFVPGETLTALLAREGSLAMKRVTQLVSQIADGLDAAHKLGIVHRDLKPDNILVVHKPDGEEVVKVVDFGIAKAVEGDAQRVTKTGMVTGTIEYMSPEQITGGDVDPRSDVFALGLVACEMLTCALPFPAASAAQTMVMRLTMDPRPLMELRPDLTFPDHVQQAIDKALTRDREQRFLTAGAFARGLALAVAGSIALPSTGPARRTARGTGPVAPKMAAGPIRVPRPPFMPIVIGATLVVVCTGVFVLLRGGTGPATNGGTSSEGGGTVAAPAAAQSARTAPSPDAPRALDSPQASSTPKKPAIHLNPIRAEAATGPAGRPTYEPAALRSLGGTLDSIERTLDPLTATPLSVAAVTEKLDSLRPLLRSRDDSVHEQVIRAEALMLSDSPERACLILNVIASRAGASRQKQINLYRTELKCE